MGEFTLSNTAKEIDSALSRVVFADSEPKDGSDNMVTSGGVKAAIDSLSQGGIDINSFDPNDVVTGSTEDFDAKLASNPDSIATITAIHNKILSMVFPGVGVLSSSSMGSGYSNWGSPSTNTISANTGCSVSVSGPNITLTIPTNRIVAVSFTWTTGGCRVGHAQWRVKFNGSTIADYRTDDSTSMISSGYATRPHSIFGRTNSTYTVTYNISLPTGISNCNNISPLSYSLTVRDYSEPRSLANLS